MDVREYHFSRRDGEAAAEGALPRELPVGRVEETRRGPRFYFTGRLRSPSGVAGRHGGRPGGSGHFVRGRNPFREAGGYLCLLL